MYCIGWHAFLNKPGTDTQKWIFGKYMYLKTWMQYASSVYDHFFFFFYSLRQLCMSVNLKVGSALKVMENVDEMM